MRTVTVSCTPEPSGRVALTTSSLPRGNPSVSTAPSPVISNSSFPVRPSCSGVSLGILPLQFLPNETPEQLGLTGKEVFEITGLGAVLTEGFPRGKELAVRATRPDGSGVQLTVTVRIDTPQELQYYRHGGILEYVLRQLLAQSAKP